MAEADPATGAAWKDRYGIAYGKGLKKIGNVEGHLSYSKLHRTGRLLKGLRKRVTISGMYSNVILENRTPYASEHELGSSGNRIAKIKPPYTRGGASTVVTGKTITARPSMKPPKKILTMPYVLINRRMRKYGWHQST